MKKSILFVCLFFFVYSIPVYGNEDYETQMNVLLKQIENCTDIENVSKELNQLYVDIHNEYVEGNNRIEQKEKELDDLEKNLEAVNEDYNELLNRVPFYMVLYQLGKEDSSLDVFIQLYFKREKLMENMNQYKKDLERHEIQCDQYSTYLETIEKAQLSLLEQYTNTEMKTSGSYNQNRTIQGTQDLPVYGGYYKREEGEYEACLLGSNYSIDTMSEDWLFPISGGTISAGTWSYPSGGLHLGLDVACSMYSSVMAPSNGLILYADAPVESDCGYLGNWCGWPLGGGNTICMICAVDDALYALTFAHLSQEIYVRAGQQVGQSDVIALSGNSGNSTGPHCHIEIFELNCTLEEAVSYFIQGADFSFANGYDTAQTCSAYACRIRPETVWG